MSKKGLKQKIELLSEEIKSLYLSDDTPWVVGYSGGKDSTATLQLVWMAIADLPLSKRKKAIHVISTDTLVENPVVSLWVSKSLEVMAKQAIISKMSVIPHQLKPVIHDTFWVNLIGRGYPAPRHKFRWCTERMKINPSNTFIIEKTQESGEAILVLGTRKAESTARAHRMTQLEEKRVRDRLSPNASLPNCLVYSPIEAWSNDDVWLYLMQNKNPWGYNNKELLTMYQGASEDGECPLVVDTSTPSCGDSRFGCWICTMVDKDKSMHAMIQNDEEKEWMLPLLELRNELDLKDDRSLRDFRRMKGYVQLFHDRPIHGPYTQESREKWLRKLLEAQIWIRKNGPSYVRDIELITQEELKEIRRIWVVEKHEIEDTMPAIYQKVTKEPFKGSPINDNPLFGAKEAALLREICGKDRLHYEMVRELIDVERGFRTKARRSGLFDALEQTVKRHFYEDEKDAVDRARRKEAALKKIREPEALIQI